MKLKQLGFENKKWKWKKILENSRETKISLVSATHCFLWWWTWSLFFEAIFNIWARIGDNISIDISFHGMGFLFFGLFPSLALFLSGALKWALFWVKLLNWALFWANLLVWALFWALKRGNLLPRALLWMVFFWSAFLSAHKSAQGPSESLCLGAYRPTPWSWPPLGPSIDVVMK